MSLFVLCLVIAGVVGGVYLFAPRGKRASHRDTPNRRYPK